MMLLMFGTGTALAVQRYKDSVSTLQVYLQDQYGEVRSVRNDRNGSQSCDSAGVGDSPEIRGQSECVILGRYVSIDGGRMTSSSVVGYGDIIPDSSDIVSFGSDFTLSIFDETTESRQLEWGAQIAWPSSGEGAQPTTTPRSIALLIVQSPVSGVVYTFSAQTFSDITRPTSDELQSMISLTPTPPNIYGRTQQVICVDAGGYMPGSPMAIVVKERAAGASAVEVRTNEILSSIEGEGAPQC